MARYLNRTNLLEIGAVFLTGGVICFFLGVISLFDARMLSFGNLLFIVGLVLLCGAPRTVGYLTARKKRRGAICFCLGLFLVLRKWAFSGFLIEIFGILNLFADFTGVIIAFLRQMPLIGNVLNNPSVSPYVERFATGNILPY